MRHKLFGIPSVNTENKLPDKHWEQATIAANDGLVLYSVGKTHLLTYSNIDCLVQWQTAVAAYLKLNIYCRFAFICLSKANSSNCLLGVMTKHQR